MIQNLKFGDPGLDELLICRLLVCSLLVLSSLVLEWLPDPAVASASAIFPSRSLPDAQQWGVVVGPGISLLV